MSRNPREAPFCTKHNKLYKKMKEDTRRGAKLQGVWQCPACMEEFRSKFKKAISYSKWRRSHGQVEA